MCGILGLVTGDSNKRGVFPKALDTLAIRGPDACGIKEYAAGDKKILLGHRRLAIIDLNEISNQPLEDHEQKISITFNGEIYNYQRLKKELQQKGHSFRTESDTEVILEGYKEYGPGIIEKLEGMFALGLYDKKQQILLLARDHFGKKPLYYYEGNNEFLFGSELKAITPLLTTKTLNEPAIAKYLMYGYIPSPETVYNEVKKLPPATYVVLDLRTLEWKEKVAYWELEKIQLSDDTFSEAVDKTDTLIREAVQDRLIADVPVGSFLSGGIDSSLVTSLASTFHPGIETFSVVYDDKKFDESSYIKMVGDTLQIKYNLFKFSDKDALSILKEVLSYLDEPMADASLLPTTFIAKQTRRKVTVGLSGDGGDEIFGGYAKYAAQLLAENALLTALLRGGKSKRVIDVLPLAVTRKQVLKKFHDALENSSYSRHFIWGSGSFSLQELRELIRPDTVSVDEESIFSASKEYFEKFQQADLGNRLLYLDAKIQLPDWYLVKVDRASMSQSLEVRSPLLDKRLAEYVFSLPSRYKFTRSKSKILLKKVAEKYLPQEVISRKKMGFGLPLNRWLSTLFREDVSRTLQSIDLPMLNQKFINQLWEEQLAGKADHGTKIWRLYILGKFLQSL